MKPVIRWGIIGPGRIAHKFAQAVNGLNGHMLQAVASRSMHRAKAFAQQHGVQLAMDSDLELVQHPQVDVVYIATPHRYHAEEIIRALNHGKPVLCEKPLTVNAREAERVFSVAEQKHLFLMEALWSRFLPVWREIYSWIHQRKIGDIIHITSHFGFPLPADPQERWLNPELAGGTLLDMGIYHAVILCNFSAV